MRSIELGVASAGLGRPGQSDEEQAEQMNKVMKITGSILEGPDSVMSENGNTTPYYQLEDDIRDLAASGLISQRDFDGRLPDWVQRGFQNVKGVKTVCG